MPKLPVVVFNNNTLQNPELIELAQEIILKTKEILSKGSGNLYCDLQNNPNAFNELEHSREQEIHLQIIPFADLVQLKTFSSQPEFFYLGNLLIKVVRSYRFKIGNCGEHSAIALYCTSVLGSNLLATASLCNAGNIDHAFLRLETKSNVMVYVDPWFTTTENSGAIVYPDSFESYLKDLKHLSNRNDYIKLVGHVYPLRHAIGIALAALTIYYQNPIIPALIISLGIAMQLLIMLLNHIQFLPNPSPQPKFTIHNTLNASAITFQYFEQLCNRNIEHIPPGPLLFSKQFTISTAETINAATPPQKRQSFDHRCTLS